MTKIAAALLAACLAIAGCASGPEPTQTVVRSVPPRNHESAVTNYFDATARTLDPNRELVIGTPQRGACPMGGGGGGGGYVGWVVPVEYRTRTKDSTTVTITRYFFWFSDEVIRGVTRRVEVCP
ncbi:MAG: hypothetical protein ABIV63_12530 [Caldimonas sp.]